jgi:hypothetical protein
MHSSMIRLSILTLLLASPSGGQAQVDTQLNAFWAELARTVREGDFEGYSRLYHPQAVLASMASGTSYPIAQALAGWEQGFIDTREGKARANVEFGFSQRLHGETDPSTCLNALR